MLVRGNRHSFPLAFDANERPAESRSSPGLSDPDQNFPVFHGKYLFLSDIGHADSSTSDKKPTQNPTDTAVSNVFEHQMDFPNHSSLTSLAGGPMYPSHTSFTAMNSHDVKMEEDYTSFYNANTTFSGGGSGHSTEFSTFGQWPDSLEQEGVMQQGRRSISNDFKANPCTSRRRSSEIVEPGSARALYLEKNRRAASKCRIKQKQQQDNLAKSARGVERRNKVLKSEVEILKSDLRDLMEVVGRHNGCTDGRLQRYVQQEADRLVAKDDPIAELLSPKGSSYGGSLSESS